MGKPESVVSSEQLSEIARGRSRTYGVLAEVLNQMPSLKLLRALEAAEPLWAFELDAAAADAAASLREALSQVATEAVEEASPLSELMTGLAVERTRLLRGVRPGYGLPPACESVYRHGVENGRGSRGPAHVWAAVSAEYQRVSFGIPKGLQPDYIGVEVSFLASLSNLEAEAWTRDDPSAALATAGLEVAFLDGHPLSWIGSLVHRVEAEASGSFWPALLATLEGHLRIDREYLEELLHQPRTGLDNAW